jgi:hypothetical protein
MLGSARFSKCLKCVQLCLGDQLLSESLSGPPVSQQQNIFIVSICLANG